MIIFAQLCYCIYYENYYNSFIMKKQEKQFLSDGSGVYKPFSAVYFSVMIQLLFRGRSRLCKNIWD